MTDLVARHEHLVPQGTQVASKGRFRYCKGFGPQWAEFGNGALVRCDDGKTYIDHVMGLGAITLGHNYARYDEEHRPYALPLPTASELILAEKVCEWMPSVEMVRFLKTGSDATSAAVRLARAYTGRDVVLRCGYHGWHDWALNADYAGKKGVPQGVRDLTVSVPYNDIDALVRMLALHHPACFILEPVSLVAPKPGYLTAVRDLCTKAGVVLIFDEVITGFRMDKGGAQSVYGIWPDLTCAGKAMGNGWPISMVGGRRDIMHAWDDTHISGTHFGDPGCMEAALMTLDVMEDRGFWQHQLGLGTLFMESVRADVADLTLQAHCEVIGHPHWWCLRIADPVKQTLWQQECIRRGILTIGSHFLSLSHTLGQIDESIKAYRSALEILADAMRHDNVAQRLEGAVNTTIFRRT